MLNIQYLKYAVEVAKTGSISKAAENLYMNQPHLSTAIRNLEYDMGITIFNRTTKGVVPTAKGEEFLDQARSILAQIEEVENAYKPGLEKDRKFSVSVPMACYISQAFVEFVKALPEDGPIKLDYRETISTQAIENVSQGIDNLGIIRYQTDYEEYFDQYLKEKNLRSELLWENEYLLVMSESSPLASKEDITEADLEGLTEITHGNPMLPHYKSMPPAKFDKSKKPHREISVYERVSQFELLQNLPDTYMWCSPTPEDVLVQNKLYECRCPSVENNRFKDVFIRRRGYKLTADEKLFCEKVKEMVKKLSEE